MNTIKRVISVIAFAAISAVTADAEVDSGVVKPRNVDLRFPYTFIDHTLGCTYEKDNGKKFIYEEDLSQMKELYPFKKARIYVNRSDRKMYCVEIAAQKSDIMKKASKEDKTMGEMIYGEFNMRSTARHIWSEYVEKWFQTRKNQEIADMFNDEGSGMRKLEDWLIYRDGSFTGEVYSYKGFKKYRYPTEKHVKTEGQYKILKAMVLSYKKENTNTTCILKMSNNEVVFSVKNFSYADNKTNPYEKKDEE